MVDVATALEVGFERELNHAGTGTCGTDRSNAQCCNIVVWIRKVGEVEYVEELGAKLNIRRLRDREVFNHAEIDILLSGTAQHVSAGCSIGSGVGAAWLECVL